jgi:hypothetical protein
MCCQPGNRHGLPASEIDRRSHYSIKMHEMQARNPTQHLVSRTGAERQGNIFSFQSREKNVLDLSSYRPGVLATLRLLFAKIRVVSAMAIYQQLQEVALTTAKSRR